MLPASRASPILLIRRRFYWQDKPRGFWTDLGMSATLLIVL
jgi:hypothetical protein